MNNINIMKASINNPDLVRVMETEVERYTEIVKHYRKRAAEQLDLIEDSVEAARILLEEGERVDRETFTKDVDNFKVFIALSQVYADEMVRQSDIVRGIHQYLSEMEG